MRVAADRLAVGGASGFQVGLGRCPVGNRTDRTLAAAVETYTYDAFANRLLSVSDATATRNFAYDAAGNITDDTGGAIARDLTYNHGGRLSSSKVAGDTLDYAYDALGQRVTKAPPGKGKKNPPPPAEVTQYHYDRDGRLLAETDGTGAALREYIHLAGLPLALIVPGPSGPELHTVHPDHLGSPQKMTDATGALTWDAQFRPFGTTHAITGTATNDQRFPGQLLDPETGLHYNYFRDYDPTLGRYIESDPIGLAGGLNTYAYVDGNPIIFVDPEGFDGVAAAATMGRGLTAAGITSILDGPIPVGEIIGAGILLSSGAYALYQLYCTGVSEEREKECDKQYYEVDIPTCRAISSRRGKAAGVRCYASAAERYAACLSGRPMPPLDTWNN